MSGSLSQFIAYFRNPKVALSTCLSRVSMARMEEREGPESNAADVLGFVGLAFAVIGLCDLPFAAKVGCLLGGSILLPVSFLRQLKWPSWVRWMLSLMAILFLGYVAWLAIQAR